jgi:hypothetical protein
MTITRGAQPPKRGAMRRTKIIPLLTLCFLGALMLLPAAGRAEQESPPAAQQGTETAVQKPNTPDAAGLRAKPAVASEPNLKPAVATEPKQKLTGAAELEKQAQDAFIQARYAEAVACNLKIVQKYPASKERRYAVQMLGTLYENNLVDIKKAIKWDQEYLKKYANSRQLPFYKETLERLTNIDKSASQEEAYKSYQKIKFSNKGDAFLTKNYEALLKAHPDFSLKTEVLKETAHAYDRMNKPQQSYAAFQAISTPKTGQKLTGDDQQMAEVNHRYWLMTTTWKWAAWAVVALLWVAVLLMKPWRRLDRAALKSFLFWSGLWAALSAMRMPTFYSMETGGFKFLITDTEIYTLASLNLPVILWLILLTRCELWQTRPRAARWVTPLLSLAMTTAVIYLFIAYHPNGPAIIDVFDSKYQYLIGEFRKGI